MLPGISAPESRVIVQLRGHLDLLGLSGLPGLPGCPDPLDHLGPPSLEFFTA